MSNLKRPGRSDHHGRNGESTCPPTARVDRNEKLVRVLIYVPWVEGDRLRLASKKGRHVVVAVSFLPPQQTVSSELAS